MLLVAAGTTTEVLFAAGRKFLLCVSFSRGYRVIQIVVRRSSSRFKRRGLFYATCLPMCP